MEPEAIIHMKEPLVVEFDFDAKCIVGKNSKCFINELGYQVRQKASFSKPNFTSQDERLKDDMISNASKGYVYEETPAVKSIILKQLATQFKNAKNKYHKHFEKFASKEEALKNIHKDVLEEDWIFLCNQFDNLEYKDLHHMESEKRTKSLSRTVALLQQRMQPPEN